MKRWPTVKIKSVTSKVGSGATPRGGEAVYKESGIPLIRSMNIHFNGFRRDGLVYLDDKEASLLDAVKVQSNDVLFNITGASIGRVTTAPVEMAGARVNQHVCIIRPSDELMPRFLSYYLASPQQQALVGSNQIGGTRQAVTKGMLLNWEIPLPPLAEQNWIVKLLDDADELRKLRAQADRRTPSLIPAVFHDMFSDGQSFPVTSLIELVDASRGISYGVVQRGNHFARGVPLVRISDFGRNVFDPQDIVSVEPSISAQYRRTVLAGGELVVSIRGTVGRVAIVPAEAKGWNVAREVSVIPLLPNVSRPFLHAYMLSSFAQNFITNEVRGMAQRGINLEDLRRLPVPLPPLSLQEEFEVLVTEIRRLEAQQASSRRHFEDLFQSLLHRAFRGEL